MLRSSGYIRPLIVMLENGFPLLSSRSWCLSMIACLYKSRSTPWSPNCCAERSGGTTPCPDRIRAFHLVQVLSHDVLLYKQSKWLYLWGKHCLGEKKGALKGGPDCERDDWYLNCLCSGFSARYHKWKLAEVNEWQVLRDGFVRTSRKTRHTREIDGMR